MDDALSKWLESVGLGHLTDALGKVGGLSPEDRDRLLRVIGARPAPDAGIPPADGDLASSLLHWPTPIALPVHEFLAESDPVLALWAACDAAEMALRFTVFVRIAELGAARRLPAKVVGTIGALLAEPTLGKWKAMALALTDPELPATGFPALSGLVRDVVVPLLDGDARTIQGSLWELRNRLAHGGGITRAAARVLLDGWRPRLERAWATFSWPSDVVLLGREEGGSTYRVLSGPHGRGPSRVLASPPDAEVILAGPQGLLPLFPFALHSRPEEASEPVQQLYVRRDEASLVYSALGSDEVWITRGDARAFAAYSRLFPPRGATRRKGFAVRGFEAELRRESDRLIGRQAELERLVSLVRSTPGGVFWLWGRAGSGKSMLMSRLACELEDASIPDTLVLPYRFRAGDDRCSRARFLEYCLERLDGWGRSPEAARGLQERDPMRQLAALRTCLEELDGQNGRVVLLLDGLDEIAAGDPHFATEVALVLGRAGRATLVVCAGRPEPGLMEAFSREEGCEWIWPDGLPPLSDDGVRAMLLEKIGPLRRRLLLNDRDAAGKVENAFVRKVARAAEGLPIFVTYVIGDILQGRYRAMDAGERVPPTLDAYHAELVRMMGVGAVAQTKTPLSALLTLAREPLAEETLRELLVRHRVLPDDPETTAVVWRTLAALSTMVRRAPTPDGVTGFTVFHHSLRQHLLENPEFRLPLLSARRLLEEAALDPPGTGKSAAGYLYRQGIAHLLEGGQVARARALLADFDYLLSRLRMLGTLRPDESRTAVRAIGLDYRAVARAGGDTEASFEVFRAFWTGIAARLERVATTWPADRLLVAAADQEPPSSPVARAAAPHRPEGVRLTVQARVPERSEARSPCVQLLEAHPSAVRALALSGDGERLLSGSSGEHGPATLLLWSAADHFGAARALPLEGGDLVAAAVDSSGEIGAAGGAGWLGTWELDTCRPLATVAIDGLCCLSFIPGDGRLATGHADGSLRIWRLENGVPRLVASQSHPGPVRAVAPDSPRGGICLALGAAIVLGDGTSLFGHAGEVTSLAASANGRFLASGDETGEVRLWNLETGTCVAAWEFGPDAVGAVEVSPDGSRVYAGFRNGPEDFDVRDRTLRVLDATTGRCEKRLVGQHDRIHALVLHPSSGQLVSGGGDGIRFWELGIPADSLLVPNELLAVGSVRAIDGGRRLLTAADDRTVRLWDARTLRCEEVYRGHEHVVWTAVAHPFAPIVYSVSEDGTLRAWRNGRELDRCQFPGERLFGLAVSPDGSFVAASVGEAQRGRPRVVTWELSKAGRQRVWFGPGDRVPSLAFSPCGRFLAAPSWDGSTYLYDLREDRLVARLPVPERNRSAESGEAVGACFDPGGRWLAVSEVYGGAFRLWDLRERTHRDVSGHVDQIRRLAFTPDGELLWTVGDDETVRVWSVREGACLDVLPLDSWATDVALLGDGREAVVGMMNGDLVRLALAGRPAGPAWVRAVRPWIPSPDDRGFGTAGGFGEWVVVCPICSARAPAMADACPSCGAAWRRTEERGG